MLRTNNMFSLGVSGLMLAGMALAAHADVTPTQTQSVSLTNTNFTQNFTFTPFNTALGTLQSITIDLTGTAVSNATVFSATSPGSYEFDSAATLKLQRPGGATTLVTILPLNPETQDLGNVGDPSLPYSFATNTATDTSGNTVFTSPSDLTLFETPGTITLPFNARGTSGVSGPGSVNSTVSTQASGSATLFYTYNAFPTSTPEPSTWAMMIAGASTGLVALRRRRNKK